MSGHSKWANIKTRKEAQDKKRAQLFTKLIRAVSVAAREGGPNPETNAKLRLAIERARAFNVPKENIERAIRRDAEASVEAFSFDAIGPGGTTMIIEGATDNRQRTLGEIRQILSRYGGKLAEGGSARWAFTRRGLLSIERSGRAEDDEALLLACIAAGAEDIRELDDSLEVIVAAEALDAVRRQLHERGVPIADATIGWVPQRTIALAADDWQKLDALIAALDEHPDVHVVWSNEETP